MATGFVPSEYSLRVEDLLPPDEDVGNDVDWREYCRYAKQVNRQDILACVLTDLDEEDSILYPLIDEAIHEPHEPGRARENITVLAKLGQRILDLIAKAVDEQVNLRMAVED